jgi:hypothetical protein
MNRLLKSSRFWVFAVTVLLDGLIALGMPESISDEVRTWLMTLVTSLGLGVIGTTTAEDAMSKLRNGSGLILLPLLLLNGACSTFFPGYDSHRALNENFYFGWDADSNFHAEGDGSQTGKFTMAEGVGLAMREDGTLDPSKGTLTGYLGYDPKADAARDAYTSALAASTQQQQQLLDSVTSMIGMYSARAAMPAAVGTADQIAQIIAARLGVPPPDRSGEQDAYNRLLDIINTHLPGGSPAGTMDYRLETLERRLDNLLAIVEEMAAGPPPASQPASQPTSRPAS